MDRDYPLGLGGETAGQNMCVRAYVCLCGCDALLVNSICQEIARTSNVGGTSTSFHWWHALDEFMMYGILYEGQISCPVNIGHKRA